MGELVLYVFYFTEEAVSAWTDLLCCEIIPFLLSPKASAGIITKNGISMRHHPPRRFRTSNPNSPSPNPTPRTVPNPPTPQQDLKSRITIGLPTQCFFDVILVPLPTAIYHVTIATILLTILYRRLTGLTARAARLQKRRSRVSRVLLGPADANAVKSRPWVRNSVIAVYYVLVAGVLAAESVEVVRFVQAGMGVGLVPVVYGGCLTAVGLRATKGGGRKGEGRDRVPGWQSASQVFWLVSAVVTLIKAIAVGRMVDFPGGRFARAGERYPAMEQLVVQVVLFVAYFLLLVVETVVQFLKPGYESALARLREVDTAEGGIEMMAGIKT